MKKRILLFLLFVFLFSLSGLLAQSSEMPASYFDMSSFPQWARDLRRAEIITFGAFPFAYLVTNISYDTYRFSQHDWDTRYAPWPIKGAGAIEQDTKEKLTVIGIATGLAVSIALIDYGIVRIKRYRAEKQVRSMPEGTPIIIMKPLGESESETETDSGTP